VQEGGGVSEVKSKSRKFEEAYGLRPCVTNEVDGKKVPRPVALLRLEDNAVEVRRGSADFDGVLGKLGLQYAAVQRLSLSDFRQHFSRMRNLWTDCRYFVDIEVATELLKPMDAVQSAFRVATRR